MKRLTGGLCVILLLAGCRSKSIQTPYPAPSFELKDLSGQRITLDSLKGHPVMLDFWATWCGPCRISIPLVKKFYEAHKDEGLKVIGMNVDEDPSGVLPFVKQFQIPYPVVFAGASSASEEYAVEGIPTFIFIDAQGRIVQRFEGFRIEMVDAWEYEFQQLVQTTH
jgi:thiol-disulfide isomerase/thioredoxin